MSDKKRLRPETFDYFLAGLSPIFVIGMIGSLVYFLVCVLYRGSFPVRLMWILGLYTVASVLIARIAIEKSRSYSLGYMAALGAAMLVATPAYLNTSDGSLVGGMLLVAPLLVLIAVLADRITFDCTSMNEDIESNGIGLLQSLGLTQSEQYKKTQPLARSSISDTHQKKRRHNPGVWILYFALGAIPIFAIGQLISVDAGNRAFAWKMVFLYLFSSLSLLVLIALLTLRKYLRDRNVEMEPSLATRWIVYGVSSCLALLILLFLIPLPSQSIFQLDLPFKITQRDNLKSSQFGWGNEGVDDPGAKSPQAKKGEPNTDPNNKGTDGQQGESSKSGQANQEQSSGNQSASKSSNSQSNETKGGDQGDKQEGDKGGDQGDRSEQSQDGRGEEKATDKDSKPGSKKDGSEQPDPKGNSSSNNNNPSKDIQSQNQSSPQTSWSLQWNPGALFQWIAMLAIIAVACFYAFLHRKAIMAFISNLLGYGKTVEVAPVSSLSTAAQPVVRDEFRTLADPFSVRGLSREQIVTKLFQALEAWGFDKRIERGDEETPDEYVKRIGKRFPEQLDNLRLLGFLYSRIAYARGKVNDNEIKPLRSLWDWLVVH